MFKYLYTYYNFLDDPLCSDIEIQMGASWRWAQQPPMNPQGSGNPCGRGGSP